MWVWRVMCVGERRMAPKRRRERGELSYQCHVFLPVKATTLFSMFACQWRPQLYHTLRKNWYRHLVTH